jgi:hypothetical protein
MTKINYEKAHKNDQGRNGLIIKRNEFNVKRKIFIDCLYSQKEFAKSIGARWCADSKKWYVVTKEQHKKWKDANIVR